MGEITEALRRARIDEKLRPPAEPVAAAPSANAAPQPTPIAGGERIASPPNSREGFWSPRALFVEDQGAVAESARHLALRVRAELEQRSARSVAVVSALHSEGKTTIAGNLALALCSLSPNRSVALLDLDLRKPSLERSLGLRARAGIDDVLLGEATLAEACISFERPPLDVYPVREPRNAAHELLVRPSLAAALRELERRYEIVVVDTAPVLLVPDTPIVLRHLPACVAVARAGHTRSQAFERMIELLPPNRLIGAVLDEGRLPTDAAGYRYYQS
jgi:succinoglycan biosynthesis transport protein ExoP